MESGNKITRKFETPFHLIPGGGLELKDSHSCLSVGADSRNISAPRFTLNQPLDREGVVDGETNIVVPILARDSRYGGSFARNSRTMKDQDAERSYRKTN
jgi:hypothetical protein